MPSILFVCIHNACRSQIAEAICRSLVHGDWRIASAGTDPSDQVDPKAAATLDRHHLVISSPKPKGFDELPAITWDYIVRIDGGEKPIPSQAGRVLAWDIKDPFDGPMELYETLFEDLTHRVRQLIREIERRPT